MMYAYITLVDGTEITHSHLINSAGNHTIEIHFERAKDDGFDSARCVLPTFHWEFRSGFTDKEISCFEKFLVYNCKLLYHCAKSGGIAQLGIKEPALIVFEDKSRVALKEALLSKYPCLSNAQTDIVVQDVMESLDLTDPKIAKHSLAWIAEKFYAAHYLHSGMM